MIKTIIIFAILQLVNVMLNTAKAVLTIKANKLVASIANAVTYGFYTIIVQWTAKTDLSITIPITIITNLIGVYISLLILEKIKKDKLWKITVSVPKDYYQVVKGCLIEKNLGFIEYETNNENYKVFDIFSHTQKDSEEIKKIVAKYQVKYIIQEHNVRL